MQSETQLWLYGFISILFLCFFIIAISDHKRDKNHNYSIAMLFFLCSIHAIVGFFSTLIDLTHGNYIAQYFCCIAYPVAGYLELFFFCKYYVETCNISQKAIKTISLFNSIILGINIIGTFVTLPFGLLFTITRDCVYTRGPLFFFTYLFVFIEMLALDVIAVLFITDRKKSIAYICYGLLPILMCIVILFTPVPSIISDIANLVSCVILYAFVYVEGKNELMKNSIKLSEYKADIMMSQIGPHFIYNTLSTISALCTIDPKKAQSLTDDFSDYLRTNLNLRNKQRLSPFTDELNHATKYLEIEKIRFGDRLNYEYDIETTNFYMPTLSLQPIVENAVKHGITRRNEGGTIKISAKEQSGFFVVSITDNGVGFDAENFMPQEGHYGLSTTKERLDILLHGHMKIESKIGEGTQVTVYIDKKDGAII